MSLYNIAVITVYDDDDLHISVYISLVLLGNQLLTKVILPVNLYKRKNRRPERSMKNKYCSKPVSVTRPTS